MKASQFAKRQWVVLGGAVLVAGVVLWSARDQGAEVGGAVDFPFTVIPVDSKNLACSSAEPLFAVRCEYDGEGARVTVEHPLRPFTTVTGEVILLAGVFEEKAVAKWLADATRTGDEKRVTVRCKGTLLGRAPQVGVRWAGDGSFETIEDIRVGQVTECGVTPGP